MVILAQRYVPSASAKNSENQRGYDEVRDVMEELMKRRVDTSKRSLWGWTTPNLNGRARVVVLEQGHVPFCQGKK
jgi:hypothetical protein